MQVLKVIIGVILSLICVLISLRFYGLSQQFQAYDHPLMRRPAPWVIAWGGDLGSGPSHTRRALREAATISGVILGLNVQMNANKHFFILPQGLNLDLNGVARKFSEMNDLEVKNIDLGSGESPLALEEVMQEFSQVPILLWINDNIENIDLRLEPILKKYAQRSNILIHSEYDNVTKSIKKLLPQLIYGTGVGQRIRMLMLSSLWLEPVASVDGDVLISPLMEQGVSAVSDSMKIELGRRQKIFILGPLNDLAANDQALSFGATGYLTSFPRDLKNKLTASSTDVDLSIPSR